MNVRPGPVRLDPPYAADPSGMARWIEGAPDQIEDALARVAADPWRIGIERPDLLAAGAMGGSAIAFDLLACLYADRLPRPLLVVRNDRWPAVVARGALAVLASYSGTTDETLALYAEARARGVACAAMTTGGTLAERCASDGVPCALLKGGMSPRAALYGSWVRASALLFALGWIPDPAPEWRAAAARMRALAVERAPQATEPANRPKQIARALHGRYVFVYAGGERLGPVAARWRTQINENAKLPAHSAEAPELCHNEIVGWERAGPIQDRAAVVILRDLQDGDDVAARLTLTADYARRFGVPIIEVAEHEGGRLARMASLVHCGDYVSLYLALLDGVDPTPIESIMQMKKLLAERRAHRAG